MHLGHLLHQRQADAQAGLRSPHVAIELHEHAEHAFLIFRRDADAAVADHHRHAIDMRPDDHRHLAAAST